MTKRRDKRNRVLRSGESQSADGRYRFTYYENGKQRCIYSWKLETTDRLPAGKRECLALREMERDLGLMQDMGQQISASHTTVSELVKKYTSIALNTSRRAGYSPHKLRATAATSLIGRGNSIYDVAALLDHEQVTTTQLYAQHKMNVKRDLVSDMEWELERTDED